jgi:hypothetical protein
VERRAGRSSTLAHPARRGSGCGAERGGGGGGGGGRQEVSLARVWAAARRPQRAPLPAGLRARRQRTGAAAVASVLTAVFSTEIYLCNACSCQEILRRNGRGQYLMPGASAAGPSVRSSTTGPAAPPPSHDTQSSGGGCWGGWGPLYQRSVHLTNIGVNLPADPDGSGAVFAGWPEVDLRDMPAVWRQCCAIFRALVRSATPFLLEQRRACDFALLGLDLLPDHSGKLWLLEVNAPPSLGMFGLSTQDVVVQGSTEPGGGRRRPDWARRLTVQMMRQLLAQFVVPHVAAASCSDSGGSRRSSGERCCTHGSDELLAEWVLVMPPTADSTALRVGATQGERRASGHGAQNRRAWAEYRRGLARTACEDHARLEHRRAEEKEAGKRQRLQPSGVAALFSRQVEFVPSVVPPPSHNYPDQNSGLTEIYVNLVLRFTS